MVKINLLDLSEDKVIFEKGSDLTESKPSKDEREFSLESVNELFQNSQTSKENESIKIVEDMQHRTSSEVSEIKKSPTSSESFKTNVDEEESFDHFPKSKILLIVITVIIILAAAAVYFFVLPEKSEVTSPQIAETPQEETRQDNSQIQSTPKVDPKVLNVFSQNRAKNNYGLNLAQKLMNTAKGDINFALMVISPNQVQFSVIANSRNSLTSYQNNLKSQFPGTNIRLVNSEEMIEAGQNKILADFSFTLTGPGNNPPVTNFQTIKPANIKAMLNSLAQKHRLNLQYFKDGKRTQLKEFTQITYYCTLMGNFDILLNYIKEISDTYPAISFSKIALNPSNLGTAGKGQFTARITMILNESTS
jgi:hypothetical protein